MDFRAAAAFAVLAILGPRSAAAEQISFICTGIYSDVGEFIDKAPTGNTSLTIKLKEGWVRSPLLLGQVSIGKIFGDEVIFSRAEGPEGKPREKQTSGSLNRVTGVLSFAKLYSMPNGEMGWTQRCELRCRPVRPIF